MLDLTTINKFYELTWFDGTKLTFNKPTEATLREITKLEGMDTEAQLEKLKEITIEILSKNNEGKKFTKAEKNQIDGITAGMILRDYMEELKKRLGE